MGLNDEALRRRARILLNRIITPVAFEDAIAWGDEVGSVMLNVLLFQQSAAIVQLLAAFAAAGSAPKARALVEGLDLQPRRLLIHTITNVFGVCIDDLAGPYRFATVNGPVELDVPDWFFHRVID